MGGDTQIMSRRINVLFGVAAATFVAFAVGLTTLVSVSAQGSSFPTAADIENYRNTVEKVFMTDRGGTVPGMAACVMCHTWQVRPLRFSLETPATDAGWTVDQSRKNFDVVTKLVNTKNPEASRLLLKPLDAKAGGMSHTGGTFWPSKEHPDYQAFLKWIRSLPADKYVPPAEPTLDFTFFRSCVQQVFATPKEGHIRCAQCHAGGQVGFAPPPQNGKAWSDEEAKRAYTSISRLIIPGNPDQSRFMLKPLHPDGGGSYAHNGVRRWQSKSDPEWQMLAGWVRGEKTGPTCS
jgi:mono/diheme cytochrome c family protein